MASTDTTDTTNTNDTTPRSPLTPYYAAMLANRVLEVKGVDKKVTPQMMYSYAKKSNGPIATVTVEGDKKVYFDGDSFKTWLDAYVSGKVASGRTVNIEALAEQYM